MAIPTIMPLMNPILAGEINCYSQCEKRIGNCESASSLLFSSSKVFRPCLLEHRNSHWPLKQKEKESVYKLVTLYIEEVYARVINQEEIFNRLINI